LHEDTDYLTVYWSLGKYGVEPLDTKHPSKDLLYLLSYQLYRALHQV